MNKKINLTDVSFLIPLRADSQDRIENLEIVIQYLHRYFDTNIKVLEVDEQTCASEFIKNNADYRFDIAIDAIFKRTEINNRLIRACQTPIGVLYDTDVIIPSVQLSDAAAAIRNSKSAFALPYDGRFLQVDSYNKKLFKSMLDIDFLEGGRELYLVDTTCSVGGCFMFNVALYKTCGIENEYIQGWGHDDAERAKRLQKLGYAVLRANGPLYHLWHERKQNSYFFDKERAVKSFLTYFKTCSVSKEALQQEISTWPWIQE